MFFTTGTGKTTVILEIVLQLHKHTDHRILVATQSNSAADLVTRRLLSANSEIKKDVLRIVSNSVLEQNLIPKELEGYAKCVWNDKDAAEDDEEETDEVALNKKRKKINVDLMKQSRIVVSTCVSIGVITKDKIDKGHFHNVIIEEGN